MDGKLSVLIPTRKRFNNVKNTINSLINNCSDINNIEILLRLDSDDVETITSLNNFILENNHQELIKLYIGDRKNGYGSLNDFNYELYTISKNEFLFIINDDIIVETKNYDLLVKPFKNKITILNHEINGVCYGTWFFPIVSRKLIEIMGHISKSTYYDGWLNNIGTRLSIINHIPLKLTHLVVEINDNLKIEKEQKHIELRGVFESLNNELELDISRIKEYLDKNG